MLNQLSNMTIGLPIGNNSNSMTADHLVDQACDPNLFEPNLSLNLEICDLINQKQKNYPREVAFAITRNINSSRGGRSGLLACSLLDCCMKNCSYPFHLIVSTKEFLNDLVKRFPERPLNIGPVQYQILSLISQWNHTLCVTSRHKNDFKHINDMYRLLQYKGYRFPELNDQNLAIADNALKSEQELEDEDKVAQSAKLQELLRIGTSAAFEEANDLIKIMAGYVNKLISCKIFNIRFKKDQTKVPDYKKMVEDELDKIQNKCFILNGILESKTPKDRWESDSKLEELHGQVKTAQTRIQNMITNSENEERMERLLELNDVINTVLSNYEHFKNGTDGKKEVTISAPGKMNTSPLSKEPNGAICLIDFDDDVTPGGSSNAPWMQSNSTTLASGKAEIGDLLSDLSSLNFSSNPPAHNNNTLSQFNFNNAPNRSPTQVGSISPISGGHRSTSPGRISPVHNDANNILSTNLLDSVKPANQYNPSAMGQFVSAQNSQQIHNKPQQNALFKEVTIFNKNGLQLKFKYKDDAAGNVNGVFTSINTTTVAMTLKLDPLSNTVLAPLNTSPATQSAQISNPKLEPIRMRFKVHYEVNGASVDETGDFSL
ncbi:hypothetical protein HK099_004551 [Clydaea vesicula]|uniref:VHS domain-containing protein n=1 Tax=Clydaea vesicula TaxID=447962 RepID=A0AAD5U045_9FUNG|nr:hypothetical protein HK099_004551 [Clydaea vesicula]